MKLNQNPIDNDQIFGTEDIDEIQELYEEMTSRRQQKEE